MKGGYISDATCCDGLIMREARWVFLGGDVRYGGLVALIAERNIKQIIKC